MKKLDRVINIVSITCAVAGVIFIGHKLWTEKESVATGISELENRWWIIAAELILMIANICLETWRWRIIDDKRVDGRSFISSIGTILESIAMSIATPAGVGEHIGKARESNNKTMSAIASAVGSIIQTWVICTFGIIGAWIIGRNLIFKLFHPLHITGIVIIGLIAAYLIIRLYFLKGEKTREYLRLLNNEFGSSKLIKAYTINVFRYFVFSFQLYLMLALSLDGIDIILIGAVFFYYMAITVIPSAGLADIGIRGSVAVGVFSNFTYVPSAWAGIAAIMIWMVNRMIPSLAGFYIIIRSVIISSKNQRDSGIE